MPSCNEIGNDASAARYFHWYIQQIKNSFGYVGNNDFVIGYNTADGLGEIIKKLVDLEGQLFCF